MGWLRKDSIVAELVVVLTFLAGAASARAAETTYSIAGVEIAVTDTSSSFAGSALAADDFAVCQAVVERTPFDANRDAVITGGVFTLDGHARDLQGSIVGGTVTNLLS